MKPTGTQTKPKENNDGDQIRGLVMKDEAWLQNQPKESVLLFPGALVSNSQEPETQQKIVVHCDECQNEIKGDIYCCQTCFDYDLCSACYQKASQIHADGKHEFVVES